ncbi:hypothetical protein V5O48_013623 [Marasmius crinis-equi]|uniref:Uncharacterized protein n=1 Tax=Marasmius crinis-equi TaxID=585013 RepID=A0ABR3EZZ0_9AGAR
MPSSTAPKLPSPACLETGQKQRLRVGGYRYLLLSRSITSATLALPREYTMGLMCDAMYVKAWEPRTPGSVKLQQRKSNSPTDDFDYHSVIPAG